MEEISVQPKNKNVNMNLMRSMKHYLHAENNAVRKHG